MASDFKIGTTSGSMTALDELTTPVLNPQWEQPKYRVKRKLGDGTLRGMGPQRVVWLFPLIETEMIEQLLTFDTGEPIYVRSRKNNQSFGVFEVLFNLPDPREDGDHAPLMRGQRNNFLLEFIVLSEVV